MIQIRYTKARLTVHIKMGLFFIVLGIILLTIKLVWATKEDYLSSFGGIQIPLGIANLILYYFENKKQYLSIANGQLTKHGLFPKTIALANISAISEAAGIYTITSTQGKMSINTIIMDPDSHLTLRSEFGKLQALRV